MRENILVLGGSGFVGRHVAEKLVDRNHGGSGRVNAHCKTSQAAKAAHAGTLVNVNGW